MNPYENLETRARNAESLQDAAAVLSDLLNGGFSVWTDGSLYNIKQLVARIKGLQIHVYANEHSPPHFHVKSSTIDAAFTISECEFMYGNIDRREQSLVRWWYERSRPKLIEEWNATRPTNCQAGPFNE